MSRTLLFEIGAEEIPSGPLYEAIAQLKTLAADALSRARLGYESIEAYGTPRRLALVVHGLAERQTDLSRIVKGPAVSAAFDAEGNPTKAAEGFARSRGIDVSSLERGMIDGGEYVVARIEEAGKPAAEVLPELLASLAESIEWPKSQRWGSCRTRFIRPVRWLVALLGDEVVPVTFAGLTAGRTTTGHRFLSGPIELASADGYTDAMRDGLVLVDPKERAHVIREQIEEAASALGARAVMPEETFAEVVNLVEHPTVGVGRFDERFLEVPRQIVEEAMESHQRYFPLEDASGSLLARFVVVHNGDPARTSQIVQGHERVIRARLADAAFFVEEDLARPLEDYVPDLDAIVFHEKLGSVGAKVRRIEALVRTLASEAGATPETQRQALRAAHLSKADLVTHAVVEFPALQGLMGMRYALASGEHEVVAEAIVDHYRPRFAGDDLPRSLAGRLVSIADKLDTIAGIFAAGQAPTGSADPYALRRSAIGVLTMMMDDGVRLDLDSAIKDAVEGYTEALPGLDAEKVRAEVKRFFDGRLEVMLKDRGFAYDEVDAVMAVVSAHPADTLRRVEALSAFRQTSAGADLAIAFRRAANLSDARAGDEPDVSLMGPEERALYDAVEQCRTQVRALIEEERDYDAALSALAALRAPVDEFFESVLVMDPDERLRKNRLALLNRLCGLFAGFADFRKLAS